MLELELLQLDASREWEVFAHATRARSIVSAVSMPFYTRHKIQEPKDALNT